jgi:hypothetical protein
MPICWRSSSLESERTRRARRTCGGSAIRGANFGRRSPIDFCGSMVNAVDSSAIRRCVAAGNPRGANGALQRGELDAQHSAGFRRSVRGASGARRAALGLQFAARPVRAAHPRVYAAEHRLARLWRIAQFPRLDKPIDLPHALSIIIIAILALVWRALLDLALVTLFVGYGIALLRIARRDAESLSAVRIGDEIAAYRATLTVGAVLVGSGLFDLVIAADFSFERGKHAATIVAIENVIVLALAGIAAAVAAKTRPAPDIAREERTNVLEPRLSIGQSAETERCDVSVLAAVEAAMRDRRLYRDPNLTLDRLARRTGIPSRQISATVNRIHGRNVSQIVNDTASRKQRNC